MSNIKNSTNNEEIDLRQLLKLIRAFFKKVFIIIFDLINFFKKKFLILITLLVIGGLGGFIWEYFFPKQNYVQEIIIEPNYDSTAYIYDFVEQFNQNLEEISLNKNMLFEKEVLKELSAIIIEPVIDYGDILNFYKDIGSPSLPHDIINDLEPDSSGSQKYINQFRYHKIRFYFDQNVRDIKGFASSFLENIKMNDYFTEKQKIASEELNMNIRENEKSLLFINEYIKKISEGRLNGVNKEVVIFGNEKEIPTVASLIREKNDLLQKIAKDKEELRMHQMLFSTVKMGDLLEDNNLLNDRIKLVPLVLLICFLGVYLLNFLYKKSLNFVFNS